MRRLLLAVSLLAGSVLLFAAPAPAQAPDAQGWWWVAGSPAGLAPPGVPADGLYVASAPSGATGVSALKFALAGGGSAGVLRLDVAGTPTGTPVVGLCVVTAEWTPVQGGAQSAAPACDTTRGTAPGTFSADGSSVSFKVGSLAGNGVLDVAVVPGTDASGGSPAFQLALAKPAPDALTPAAGSEPTAPSTGSDTAASPSFSPAPSSGGGSYNFVPQPPDAPLLASPAPAVVGPPASSGRALPLLGTGTRPLTHSTGGRNGWRILGFVLLGSTAFAYHRLSITPDRAPRSLVAFGQAPAEEQV